MRKKRGTLSMGKGILLSDEDLSKTTKDLKNWKIEDGKLRREYIFGSFIEAFAFLAGAAILSESMNHHIEWYNLDRKLIVWLKTPDLGGISTIDILLAKKLDELNKSQ